MVVKPAIAIVESDHSLRAPLPGSAERRVEIGDLVMRLQIGQLRTKIAGAQRGPAIHPTVIR